MDYRAQTLFFSLIDRIKQRTKGKRGITPGIGKLKLIDSSGLTLPPILAKWSYCSKSSHGVKMHTSLVVAHSKTRYPDIQKWVEDKTKLPRFIEIAGILSCFLNGSSSMFDW
ncbi:hypothetical protein WJ0W_002149 [Paenibacillus melissococcoides]|uniref:Uncharacterized protein n=1 Tax=Paenibacillus melissococcoides TaxID=2912268 RepID=A0ABN8U3V0_9BACL|nr:hypothetical protein [Paenibacillus melissococcoides]CAH8244918.1 hypothetical protein WJ0W_002149 [Paenibacillus melissococcoides]CAH8709363.1 hypothetical protein WDD9_002230 [Paenibacillus melissococcoides]CAH8710090.1 hypothetical protein HTL2_002518 [Paenibacillus melissococcoides]